MCLETSRKFNGDPNKERIGWQRFELHYGVNGNEIIQGSIIERRYKIGKWYKASNKMINDDEGFQYESGFHIYLKKQDAVINCRWRDTVFKVKYRNTVVSGLQFGKPVHIAKERMIIGKVNL